MTAKEQDHSETKQLTVSVRVDRFDRIIAVSENWNEIAEQGEALQSLDSKKVLGQPLVNYIRDDATSMYIEACLKLCRVRNQILSRNYRCDSPTHKRFLELVLTPLPQKSVEMTHYLLKEEPFAHRVDIEDVTDTANQKPFQYVRCSMCNALRQIGTDQWQDPASLSHQQNQAFKVIHGICPVCKTKKWHAHSS